MALRLAVSRHCSTSVANSQTKKLTFAHCGGLDKSFILAIRNAMANCILHNGLKQKARDEAIDRARINLELQPQTVRKAHLLNGQVILDQFDFSGQRHSLRSSSLQRGLKNRVQISEHFGRLL